MFRQSLDFFYTNYCKVLFFIENSAVEVSLMDNQANHKLILYIQHNDLS